MTLFRKKDFWRDDPIWLISRISARLYTWWIRATFPLASMGRNVEIHYRWDIRKFHAHRVSLGNSVLIEANVQFGISCPLAEEKGEPIIVIEDGCDINHDAQISSRNYVHIESDVLVSPMVLIMDHAHAFEDINIPIKDQGITTGGKIRIEQGCWIGRNAVIVCTQGELVLGRNCVVAANALVTRSFPPYSVIAGNPARIVRQYDPARQTWGIGVSRAMETESVK